MPNESKEPEPDGSSAGRSAAVVTAEREQILTPDQEARQDLIRWCSEHGLPVPPPRPNQAD